MKLLIAASLVTFVLASPVFSQTQTVAVVELKSSTVPRENVLTVATEIAGALSAVGSGLQVIGPTQTTQQIQGTSILQLQDYRERSAAIGRHVGADYVVAGSVARADNGYTLNLELLEIKSDSTIHRYNQYLANLDSIAQSKDDIAKVISATIERRNRPKKQREKLELDYATSVSIGMESMTAISFVPGGSHLYLGISGILNDTLALEARYSIGLFPTAISSHIASATVQLHIPYAKEAGVLFGAGYSAASTDYSEWAHLVRVSLTPIYSGETDDFVFGLFPMALSYDIRRDEYLFTFSLLAMSILF